MVQAYVHINQMSSSESSAFFLSQYLENDGSIPFTSTIAPHQTDKPVELVTKIYILYDIYLIYTKYFY